MSKFEAILRQYSATANVYRGDYYAGYYSVSNMLSNRWRPPHTHPEPAVDLSTFGYQHSKAAREAAGGDAAIGELMAAWVPSVKRSHTSQITTGRWFKKTRPVVTATESPGTLADFSRDDNKIGAVVLGYRTLTSYHSRESIAGIRDSDNNHTYAISRTHCDPIGRPGVESLAVSVVPSGLGHDIISAVQREPRRMREFARVLFEISGAAAITPASPLLPDFGALADLGVTRALIQDATRDPAYTTVVDMTC